MLADPQGEGRSGPLVVRTQRDVRSVRVEDRPSAQVGLFQVLTLAGALQRRQQAVRVAHQYLRSSSIGIDRPSWGSAPCSSAGTRPGCRSGSVRRGPLARSGTAVRRTTRHGCRAGRARARARGSDRPRIARDGSAAPLVVACARARREPCGPLGGRAAGPGRPGSPAGLSSSDGTRHECPGRRGRPRPGSRPDRAGAGRPPHRSSAGRRSAGLADRGSAHRAGPVSPEVGVASRSRSAATLSRSISAAR